MPGPWITDNELLQEVADIIKKPLANLEAYWARIVTNANTDAANDINSILQGKGFTVGQIDQWDNRVTYNRDIALYLAFKKAAGLAQYDQEAVDTWDRRKQLIEAANLMIGGVIVAPGDPDGAGSETGAIDIPCSEARYGREQRGRYDDFRNR